MSLRTLTADLEAQWLVDHGTLARICKEFPRLASEIAASDELDCLTADVPSFGLAFATPSHEPDAGPEVDPTVVLIGYEGRTPVGVLSCENDAAVEWAKRTLDSLHRNSRQEMEVLAQEGTSNVHCGVTDLRSTRRS